jgi:hypothetical protein
VAKVQLFNGKTLVFLHYLMRKNATTNEIPVFNGKANVKKR